MKRRGNANAEYKAHTMKRIATLTDNAGNVTGLVHGPDLVDQHVI